MKVKLTAEQLFWSLVTKWVDKHYSIALSTKPRPVPAPSVDKENGHD